MQYLQLACCKLGLCPCAHLALAAFEGPWLTSTQIVFVFVYVVLQEFVFPFCFIHICACILVLQLHLRLCFKLRLSPAPSWSNCLMDLGLHFDQFPVFYSSLTVNTVNKYTFESQFCLSLSLSISGTMNYLTTEPYGVEQTKSCK